MSSQETWIKSLATRIVAEAEQSIDEKVRPVQGWTREDRAIEAYAAEAAGTMPPPSKAQRVQERVAAEEAQLAEVARKERVKAWYSEMSDEGLEKFADKIRAEQSRRAGPGVADEELAEPVVEGYDYDKPTLEEGYEPVAGFRYPDHRTEDDWTSSWSTEPDVDTDVDETEDAE